MNIQAYIESGKLELFLLGELSDREREEVLALAKQHPEIQKELDEIEEAMLAFDQASAPIPSAGLKEKIMADLEKDFAPVKELKPTVAPEETGKVVKISPWKPFAVAASIVLIFTLSFILFNRVDNSNAPQIAENSFKLSNLPADHITNIALGACRSLDHAKCKQRKRVHDTKANRPGTHLK